jgi:hypothetical protein
MENQITFPKTTIPSNLTSTLQELSNQLSSITVNSKLKETQQIINYVLIATAITGIFVYHYIKNQELE